MKEKELLKLKIERYDYIMQVNDLNEKIGELTEKINRNCKHPKEHQLEQPYGDDGEIGKYYTICTICGYQHSHRNENQK